MKETPIRSLPGIPFLLGLFLAVLAGGWMAVSGIRMGMPLQIVAGILLAMAALFCMFGLYMVEPNPSAVLSLFGKYIGTV